MRVSAAMAGESIHAQAGVELGGWIAVGGYILQIGSIHGGAVRVALPEERPRVTARPSPVLLRPQPFPELLDRETEVEAATKVLGDPSALEVVGPPGIGKTALLRRLAFSPATRLCPAGVVYLQAAGVCAADLLIDLFRAFHDTSAPYRPAEMEIRRDLGGRRALVIVDDLGPLSDVELRTLLDAAPESTLIFASTERRLFGEGRSLLLGGLPDDAACALMERELGRALAGGERSSASSVVHAAGGHPLRVLQAAVFAREKAMSLGDLALLLDAPRAFDRVADELVARASPDEARVLVVLATVAGLELAGHHVGVIAGLPDPAPALASLVKRGLVEAREGRYRSSRVVASAVERTRDLREARATALEHFARWAAERSEKGWPIDRDAAAIVALARAALAAGQAIESLGLVRAAEGALAIAARWGAWRDLLATAHEAARATGDKASAAWALHQIGTRALCMGDEATALESLAHALRIRDAIGDSAGAALTRQNLEVLDPGAPGATEPRRRTRARAVLLSVAAIVAIAGLLLWAFGPRPTATAEPHGVSPKAAPSHGPAGKGPQEAPSSRPAPEPSSTPSSTPEAPPGGPPPATPPSAPKDAPVERERPPR